MNQENNQGVSYPPNGQGMPTNTMNQNMFNQPMYSNSTVYQPIPEEKKGKWKTIHKKKLGIILGIVFVVVILFLVIRQFTNNSSKYTYDTLTDTTSFFIEDDNNKYALFNEDGKQLTDFIFTYNTSFYGGVAVVKNEDYQYALMKENGKYLRNFSENSISLYGLIYGVEDDELNTKIINQNGKTILEGTSLDIDSFYGKSLILVGSYLDDSANKTVISYRGKILDSVPNETYSISSDVIDGYVTLIGENTTYLYNVDTGKKILSTDGKYCIHAVEGNSIILNSCSSWYESDTLQSYKVIKKGKELYTISKDDCSSLSLTEDGEVACYNKSQYHYSFVNDKGEIKEDTIEAYLSSQDYIVEEDKSVIFYENGKKVATASCTEYYSTTDDGYILRNLTTGDCDNESGYVYYSKSGNKLSTEYVRTSNWDQNGIAIVGTASRELYLVDKKFNTLSDTYAYLYTASGFYVGEMSDGTYVLLNQKQEKIEQGFQKYSRSSRGEGKDAFIALYYDDKIVLYNITESKKVGEYTGEDLEFYTHYYTVDNQYYSYNTGKLFYKN